MEDWMTRFQEPRFGLQPAWEGIARVSGEPPGAFTFEQGEETPSYIENFMLWLVRQSAKSGQRLFSQAVLRRAGYVTAAHPELARKTSELALELIHQMSAAPWARARRSVRVTFTHTLMRYKPLPIEFVGSGDRPLAIMLSVPAAWEASGFEPVIGALTQLFDLLNAFLNKSEPADPNFLCPTSILGLEPLDARELIERAWEKEISPPGYAIWIGTCLADPDRIKTIDAPDFVRLTYAGLAAEQPAHKDRIAAILGERFGVDAAEAVALIAEPQATIETLLARLA